MRIILERGLGRLELLEHLTDRNPPTDPGAINAATNFCAFKIVNTKHWIATKVLVEPFVLRCIAERIDEHRYEAGRSRNHSLVSKRTARKVSTASSAGVFAKV